MLDELIIEGVGSNSYGASLKECVEGIPAQKTIKVSVPFSNTTYDFSDINGEVYWEERELEYVFEIIADSPQELEEKKIAFTNWIVNVRKKSVTSAYNPAFKFTATYSSLSYEDDESVLKTTAAVVFTADPFKRAQSTKTFEKTFNADNTPYGLEIVNDGESAVSPTITLEGASSVIMNWTIWEPEYKYNSFEIEEGTHEYPDMLFEHGATSVSIFPVGEGYFSNDVTIRVEIHVAREVI